VRLPHQGCRRFRSSGMRCWVTWTSGSQHIKGSHLDKWFPTHQRITLGQVVPNTSKDHTWTSGSQHIKGSHCLHKQVQAVQKAPIFFLDISLKMKACLSLPRTHGSLTQVISTNNLSILSPNGLCRASNITQNTLQKGRKHAIRWSNSNTPYIVERHPSRASNITQNTLQNGRKHAIRWSNSNTPYIAERHPSNKPQSQRIHSNIQIWKDRPLQIKKMANQIKVTILILNFPALKYIF